MNLTLKEIPDGLHRELKKRAESHGRSLNKEVIAMLEDSVNPVRSNPVDLLEKIVQHRESLPHLVKEDELESIIDEGRR